MISIRTGCGFNPAVGIDRRDICPCAPKSARSNWDRIWSFWFSFSDDFELLKIGTMLIDKAAQAHQRTDSEMSRQRANKYGVLPYA